MPGLVAYSAAGLGLLALAALEALPLRLPPLPRRLLLRSTTPQHAHRHLLAALLSALCLLSALLSAPHHHLSLPTLAASALFLLYSLTPFLLPLPPPPHLLDLLLAAAFAQELLLFAHRRPSTAAGIENRYFDLLLVPVTLCLGATLLAAHSPGAAPPRLARAAGLALQGTWMLQMGFSFFTNAVATGCALHATTRVDYTIKCRTHEDYHRARSVATLQFNGHLALLVLAGAAAYAAVVSGGGNPPPSGYRKLGKEEVQMEGMPSQQFTLDSDEEKEGEEITTAATVPVPNGVHSHHQIELQVPDSK